MRCLALLRKGKQDHSRCVLYRQKYYFALDKGCSCPKIATFTLTSWLFCRNAPIKVRFKQKFEATARKCNSFGQIFQNSIPNQTWFQRWNLYNWHWKFVPSGWFEQFHIHFEVGQFVHAPIHSVCAYSRKKRIKSAIAWSYHTTASHKDNFWCFRLKILWTRRTESCKICMFVEISTFAEIKRRRCNWG